VIKSNINRKLWHISWCLLGVMLFTVVIAIRIRLLGIPLERDEGEYAYAGQLILQGIPPYKLAYNMKFPGTYVVYAGMMSIFGQTITGIHLGLLLVNAATIVLIFCLGRRLVNSTAGLTAAMSYAVLSVSPSVLGFAGHATHFVILPVLAGALLLLNASDRQLFWQLFASGLLFGLGLLMKQPAIFFVLFAMIYLISKGLHQKLKWKRILWQSLIFSAGVILPVGATCLLLWYAGVFDKFWFWTIDYAGQYGRLLPLSAGMRILGHNVMDMIWDGCWPLWILAGIGLWLCACVEKTRANAGFLIGLLVFSAVAVCSGFYFRPHYFILVLPAVSLLVGVAVSKVSELIKNQVTAIRIVFSLLFVAAVSFPVVQERRFLFTVPINSIPTLIYGQAPFLESARIGDYIREHSNPSDTIAVLGSEPEIYFYARRHSATGYIYMYGLLEPQKYARQMQLEMIHEIERARPAYLISVVIENSWTLWRQSERSIFKWAAEYTAQNYDAIGFVNITPVETDYFFGDVPASVKYLKDYILIYKRKP
jgi:4-amino-4-deoxy-L-arabinose transferase-like glycosyltransferase